MIFHQEKLSIHIKIFKLLKMETFLKIENIKLWARVGVLDEAITHIQKYSSKHTDGIITENSNTANKIMNLVDSAGVFHNCSTRFADGFRYGFGAEVGISTQTLPPRGPVGLEGLVTYKYFLKGDGNIVDDFSSGKAIYTHKDL